MSYLDEQWLLPRGAVVLLGDLLLQLAQCARRPLQSARCERAPLKRPHFGAKISFILRQLVGELRDLHAIVELKRATAPSPTQRSERQTAPATAPICGGGG